MLIFAFGPPMVLDMLNIQAFFLVILSYAGVCIAIAMCIACFDAAFFAADVCSSDDGVFYKRYCGALIRLYSFIHAAYW